MNISDFMLSSSPSVSIPTSSEVPSSSTPGVRDGEQPKIVVGHDTSGKAYIAGYVDGDGRSITAEEFHRHSMLGDIRLTHPILNREKPNAFQKHREVLTEREKADAQRIAATFARKMKQ
jgi:hypothetical protein